jgi:hypothetical protein
MGFFDIVGRLLGLVPDAVKAGEQIVEAVKPKPKIDPADITLHHTLQHDKTISIKGNLGNYTLTWCNVCQSYVLDGRDVCQEMLRRRNEGTG